MQKASKITALVSRCLRARNAVGMTIVAAATILGIACESPTYTRLEPAYSPTTLTQGKLYRWSNNRTLRVWIADSTAAATQIYMGTAIASEGWNSIPIFGEFRLVAAQAPSEANILVVNRADPLPFAVPASCPFVPDNIGYTYFCVSGNQAMTLNADSGGEATVVISIDMLAITSIDHLTSVIAHELGHALGIGGHSTEAGDIMALPADRSIPSDRDKDTMRFVLGQHPDFRL